MSNKQNTTIVAITQIDESTRQVAEQDSGDGRWSKGDEVALVETDYHPGCWTWACVKEANKG